ncbi:hypothetical protein PIB30_063172 [Stylosanthes scabra]|uniref:Aminotransferase-like plant mobile domain-containing protein n=1 Tax=Stylosanthes scabra TaxID=79078 RepID=A0ABU6ZK52_9FABA|nr:hypothetical protein [Stylosanthes scabra]
MMPEGTRRPRWDWFQEMFGELPDERNWDPCTVTFSWFEQLFEIVQFANLGPTAYFIQSWILAARRYLVPADHFHRFPPDEIPVEATQRQLGPHSARPGRSMMVRTRTTARDWQWLDKMMAEDASA